MKRLLAALGAYRKARAAARTRRELRGLSDHMLRDLGLRREQIELVGRDGAFQSRLRR